MRLLSFPTVLEIPGFIFSYVSEKLLRLLLSPGSSFSLASLLSALCVAILFLGLKRSGHKRQVRIRVLLRALFPRCILQSPSSRADVGFFVFNVVLAGALFGWAILSYHLVSTWVDAGLVSAFGALQPTSLSPVTATCLLTVALFLAYELGYWIDHYLAHRIPVLWEFHKVHHSAEVLSPLTNFRVHPVDSLVFYNILALVMGTTGGLVNYGLGRSFEPFTIANSNVMTLVFTYLLTHLQHTHLWIAFTGVWGRIFLSPAHHQVHHSTNPIHFDKNLGAGLAIWDWLFGTLHMPSRKRERLTFGVEPRPANPHTMTEGLIAPIGHALGHIKLPARLSGASRLAAGAPLGEDAPPLVAAQGSRR
jgi:sterol desaturase/sphingolipid hydroxylase (fatty acid hydroxylase superfamily)